MDDIVELMAVGSVSSSVRSEFGFHDLGGRSGADNDYIATPYKTQPRRREQNKGTPYKIG